MELTELETKALAALNEDSRGNGHDFGVMEFVEWDGSRQQLGGLVTSLQAKGVLHMEAPHKVNGNETVTQYVIAPEFRA